jgi:hypothetical protein
VYVRVHVRTFMQAYLVISMCIYLLIAKKAMVQIKVAA